MYPVSLSRTVLWRSVQERQRETNPSDLSAVFVLRGMGKLFSNCNLQKNCLGPKCVFLDLAHSDMFLLEMPRISVHDSWTLEACCVKRFCTRRLKCCGTWFYDHFLSTSWNFVIFSIWFTRCLNFAAESLRRPRKECK